MKTLGLILVFAASNLVNVLAGNVESKFAYNVEKNGEQVTSQTVYHVEEGKYLKQHLKYEFHYDAANRLTQKEAWKWNVDAQAYERYYCLNYHYADDEVTMEYALWNELFPHETPIFILSYQRNRMLGIETRHLH